MLEALKNQWYAYQKEKYEFKSWYYIIYRLIKVVSGSEEQTKFFKAEHPNLLVANSVKRNDIVRMNQRRQALSWLKQIGKPYRLVQDGFRAMGYPALEETCANQALKNRCREWYCEI